MLPAPQPHFQSASLYVGDLDVDVTEATLWDMFQKVGPVASIRVCRDTVTRRSLGYAYVNFHNVLDAERALDTLNFTDVKERPDRPGRPCRIMWSQRDPSLRKSGVGNIFVKNLYPECDNKVLCDLFSPFGNILSCKVVTDSSGASKGYGYVHFETDQSAQDAITKLNNATIEERVIVVGKFVKKDIRPDQAEWTNLYVKHFPESWDEAKLTELFGEYGVVANIAISRDPATSKSRKFGFVNYDNHASAQAAYDNLSNKEFEDESGSFTLYVNKAQKKVDRMKELKIKADQRKSEMIGKFQGMNLYVKNIDDSVTEDFLKETFANYGTITSARLAKGEDGVSKGFGFICFTSPEEATNALTNLNGKPLNGKPITVTLHQRKEVRRAHLASIMAPRSRFPGSPQGMPYGGVPMMYGPGMRGPFPMIPGMMQRGPPRGPMANFRQQQMYPMPSYGVPNMQMPQNMKGRPGQVQMPPQAQMGQPQGGHIPRSRTHPGVAPGRGIPGGRGQLGMQPMPAMPGPRVNVAGMQYTKQARNQPPQAQGQNMLSQNSVTDLPAGDPLLPDFLANLDPQRQKNAIGERLYPLIYSTQSNLAGKITGMLLEMDNGELLHLLDTPEALNSKIDEALQVLNAHKDPLIT